MTTVNVPTNSEAGTLWSFTPSRVGDQTPIVACFELSHMKCATATREVLPPILLTLLSKLFPLPLVAQRLCTSGLDWEHNFLPWKNILLAHWLGCNLGRLSCKNELEFYRLELDSELAVCAIVVYYRLITVISYHGVLPTYGVLPYTICRGGPEKKWRPH